MMERAAMAEERFRVSVVFLFVNKSSLGVPFFRDVYYYTICDIDSMHNTKPGVMLHCSVGKAPESKIQYNSFGTAISVVL